MTGTWLITGAGRGMGVEYARAALATDHNVVVPGRNPDTVRSAVELPLEDAADGYRAMDQRDAITTLLRP